MDTCDPVTESADSSAKIRDDPDLALVQAVACGDERALEALYARHGLRLLAYLTGLLGDPALAEEGVQDVMLAAWRGAPSFRGESTVRTWLLAIARRRARRMGRRHTLPQTRLEEAAMLSAFSPPDLADQEAEQTRVHEALAQLSPEQRETLELVFYHELSGPEAAAVLGVALGTVKSRLFRAKAALKSRLGRREPDDA